MNKLIIVFSILLAASSAFAQSPRSLKDIDKELKQTKSTATAMTLIESIAETVPQTDEDVSVLGQLMDKYPTQGQKALSKIKDPQLAQAVMKECDRQVAKFKTDKDKDWKTLPEAQRREKFNALLNTQAMIATLGNLKNKETLPYLKQYITPEYDGVLSYTASQAIGQVAPDDPAVFKELWEKQGIKNISYNAYGKSVLKEVAQKMQDPNIPSGEKHKILWKAKPALLSGRDPEEKRLLKDILRNHPDKEFRYEAAIAMVHAAINNPESEDKKFIMDWVKSENGDAVVWAPSIMDKLWGSEFILPLIDLLRKSAYSTARSGAAEILGRHKIKESLPYLEECIENDKDDSVRGECRDAYWQIAGKIPVIFHPDDVTKFNEQFNDPARIALYAKMKEDNPVAQKRRAIQEALREYKQTRPVQGRNK